MDNGKVIGLPKSGYINVRDLIPSYQRAKVFDPTSGLATTFDGQILFSAGQVQQALPDNQQRAQIVFVAMTAGPFYVRLGSDAKEFFGYPLPSQFANFERSAKTSFIHKGPITVWAASTSDILYVLEASMPGIGAGGEAVEWRPGNAEIHRES